MIRPVHFAGTFSQLDTYSVEMGAAARPKGISSEDLDGLRRRVQAQFPNVTIRTNVYDSPATLVTSGPQEGDADAVIKKSLNDAGTHFDYKA